MGQRGENGFSAIETREANRGAQLMLDKDGKAVNHSAEKPKNPINISILI